MVVDNIMQNSEKLALTDLLCEQIRGKIGSVAEVRPMKPHLEIMLKRYVLWVDASNGVLHE